MAAYDKHIYMAEFNFCDGDQAYLKRCIEEVGSSASAFPKACWRRLLTMRSRHFHGPMYARLAYSQQTCREGYKVRVLARKKVAVAPARVFSPLPPSSLLLVWLSRRVGRGANPTERHSIRKRSLTSSRGSPGFGATESGYFAPKGRFLALGMDSEAIAGTLSGDWVISQDGTLCFSGLWKASCSSCFEPNLFLAQDQGWSHLPTAAAKREWYVFKHDPEKPR